jgi:hypothetical protein
VTKHNYCSQQGSQGRAYRKGRYVSGCTGSFSCMQLGCVMSGPNPAGNPPAILYLVSAGATLSKGDSLALAFSCASAPPLAATGSLRVLLTLRHLGHHGRRNSIHNGAGDTPGCTGPSNCTGQAPPCAPCLANCQRPLFRRRECFQQVEGLPCGRRTYGQVLSLQRMGRNLEKQHRPRSSIEVDQSGRFA